MNDGTRQIVYVLVHPGSACGSADCNLGRQKARAEREALAREIDALPDAAGFIVIDGFLSDELPQFPVLDLPIRRALKRCAKGLKGRVWGCDAGPGAAAGLKAAIARYKLDPERHELLLSGAWHNPTTQSGCVTSAWLSVRDTFKCRIADAVIEEEAEDEPEEANSPAFG